MKKKIFIGLITINHLSNFCSEEEPPSLKKLNSELHSKRKQSKFIGKLKLFNPNDSKKEKKKLNFNNFSSSSINKSREATEEK